MIPVDRQSLVRHFRTLRNGEAVNAVLLPALLAWRWSGGTTAPQWAVRLPGLLLLSFLLIQGAAYWHLKADALTTRGGLPDWFCDRFTILRAAAIGGLISTALCPVLAWRVPALRGSDIAWTLILFLFSGLELLNYYSHQLTEHRVALVSRDVRRRFREPPLARDLMRTCFE